MDTVKVFIVLLSIAVLVESHCYLTNPRSRGDQKTTQTGCRYGNDAKRDSSKRSPTCSGPCDKLVGQGTVAPTNIARGTSVTVNWVRHYHSGGFIRFAWAPTPQSDSHSVFDNNVFFYMCKETGGCSADTEPADCGVTFNIPPHLTDGPWTLSWAYFGGEYAAGDYYACVDYIVSGGPSGARPSVVFYGGDANNVGGSQCRFYQTNDLHVCTLEPCTNGTVPGGPHMGVPKAFESTGVTPPPSPVTTGPLTTNTPFTTGDNTPKVSTQALTTHALPYTTQSAPVNNFVTTAAEGTVWCYKQPNPPNLNGPINNPPTCGVTAPNARCPDDQCCSTTGVCGPTRAQDGFFYEVVDGITQRVSDAFAYDIYCKDTTADYRKTPCNSAFQYQMSISLLVLILTLFL